MANTDVRVLFELATRYKWRWNYKGLISVEILWGLSVEELDQIFKDLNAQVKKCGEESLLISKERSRQEIELDHKISIVKHIVLTKLNEAELAKQCMEEQRQKQKIMDIIARKEDAALEGLSLDELRKML